MPSAVERAYERREAWAGHGSAKVQWFINEVCQHLTMTLEGRLRTATSYLLNRIVQNISRPVTKTYVKRVRDTSNTKTGGPKGSQYTKVTDRSKAGEFPKADTTLLMTSLFMDIQQVGPYTWDGHVGSPLDYGLILEVSEDLDRRYMSRTLEEELGNIVTILTQHIGE